MGSRRWIALLLMASLLAAACAAPSTSPAGSGAGSSPDGSRRPLPSLGPFIASPEALAERDERVWAAGLEASGARALLGPGLVAWLDEQRHDFVDAVLEEGGLLAGGRVASTDQRTGLAATQTALGGAGMTLAMTGAFLREFTSSYTPERNGPNQDFSLPHSETHETEVDGRRATVQMSIEIDFHFSGARVSGTVSITITTTIFDANGQVVGTITVVSTSTVDMEVCPDIDGALNAHFETENEVTTTGVASSSGGSYRLATSGVATGQVNDNALLSGMRVSGEASQRSSGAGTREVDAAVHLDVRSAYTTPGDVGSLQMDESSFSEDVTRGQETVTSDDLTRLDIEILGTGVIVASLLFEAAQKKWQSGYCVRIEATESTRDVTPDEVVPFSAKVFHNFDGSELDQPIVATFSGVASATPLDVPQDPPANITYTAGATVGDQGTVTLKTTSRRGIGTLALTFTVASQLVLLWEVESTITATKLAGLPGGGVAKVTGAIYLRKDRNGHWHGEGELAATTTPGAGGCNTAIVETTRLPGGAPATPGYDWQITDVVAGPGITNIELSMDSGQISETPDTATLTLCPGFTDMSPINTWENLFFVSHNKDFKSMGFLVVGWTIVATADTWKFGGPVADATWQDSCTGPSALPKMDKIVNCTGTTEMHLSLVPPPVP